MTDIEIAWLAGLLEGEGSFGNYSKKTMVDLRLQLSMSDRDVIAKAAKLLGKENIYTYDRFGQKNYRSNHKPLHVLQVRGYAAARTMEAILPFMGIRRRTKILELLAVWNAREARTRERGLPATCHPEKPHYCRGLCRLCYTRLRYSKNKDAINLKRREKKSSQLKAA